MLVLLNFLVSMRAVVTVWPFVFCSEKILKLATNISRDKLVSVGTCFGKFTKTHLFRLQITSLDFLAPYAKVSDVVHHFLILIFLPF